MPDPNLSSFIWSVADLLRGDYKQSEYGKVILPFTGAVAEEQRVYITAIIEKLNDLFGKETTDQDQLVYVNGVILGKLLESQTLRQQATNNSKEQFSGSPDLLKELDNAIIEALDAHTDMSTKALNSSNIKKGILRILLEHSGLWEKLRESDTAA